MKRQQLIKRLVTAKRESRGKGKVGCVPCFGKIPDIFGSNSPARTNAKN